MKQVLSLKNNNYVTLTDLSVPSGSHSRKRSHNHTTAHP